METLFALMRNCGDGAFAVDRRQRIVLWNSACASIFGFSADEVLTKPCHTVIGAEADGGCHVCQRNCQLYQQAASRCPVPSIDICSTARDGRDLWLNVSTIRVPSSWHDLSVVLHLVRDITARKHIERSMSELAHAIVKVEQDAWLESEAEPDASVCGGRLTPREHEVLRVLGTGATTPEIADSLFISRATTRNHIHNIISKLGVRNRLEAVTAALRDGVL